MTPTPEAKGFQNLEIRFVVSSWQVNLVFVTTCVMTIAQKINVKTWKNDTIQQNYNIYKTVKENEKLKNKVHIEHSATL